MERPRLPCSSRAWNCRRHLGRRRGAAKGVNGAGSAAGGGAAGASPTSAVRGLTTPWGSDGSRFGSCFSGSRGVRAPRAWARGARGARGAACAPRAGPSAAALRWVLLHGADQGVEAHHHRGVVEQPAAAARAPPCASRAPAPWARARPRRARRPSGPREAAPGGRRGLQRRRPLELRGVDGAGVEALEAVDHHLRLAVEQADLPLHQQVVAQREGAVGGLHVVEDAAVDLAGAIDQAEREEGLARAGLVLLLSRHLEDGVHGLAALEVLHVHLADLLVRR